jgi:hypothetical protein
MIKESMKYLETLVNIKKKSVSEMTDFQILHLSGLLLNDENHELAVTKNLINFQFIESIKKWLITGEEKEEKEFINIIKQSVIDIFSENIDILLKHAFQQKEKQTNEDAISSI